MIVEPEGANAFMNIGYAGCIGSITGMNEQQITIGEMGGAGQDTGMASHDLSHP